MDGRQRLHAVEVQALVQSEPSSAPEGSKALIRFEQQDEVPDNASRTERRKAVFPCGSGSITSRPPPPLPPAAVSTADQPGACGQRQHRSTEYGVCHSRLVTFSNDCLIILKPSGVMRSRSTALRGVPWLQDDSCRTSEVTIKINGGCSRVLQAVGTHLEVSRRLRASIVIQPDGKYSENSRIHKATSLPSGNRERRQHRCRESSDSSDDGMVGTEGYD